MKPANPILIEALTLGNDSGLGKINRMLLKAFEKILADEKVILISRQRQTPFTKPDWMHLSVKARPLRLWLKFIFPFYILKFKPRLVICLGFNIPGFRFKTPYWLLVCDVGPLENLPFRTSKFDEENKKRFPGFIKGARYILTISEFSKNRIHQKTGTPLENIGTFKPVGAESFTLENESPPTGNPVNIEGEFLFSHGNLEPRKNHLSLIRGYALALKKKSDLPLLIIAGHKAWGYTEIINEVKKLGLEDKVMLTGYLDNKTLRLLMEKCTLYLNCSLYEGWGFPLFEALEMGKPAIYHLESSQKEFAENFALGIDCTDIDSIAAAITELLESEERMNQLKENLAGNFKEMLEYDLPLRLKELFTRQNLIPSG